MLRIFDESMRTGTLIHPDAMRLIAANLHLIDDQRAERPGGEPPVPRTSC